MFSLDAGQRERTEGSTQLVSAQKRSLSSGHQRPFGPPLAVQAPPPSPPPLLSETSLGQLVLASGGGMGWLSSTRQGLFTMADDLEQQ